MQAAKMVSVLLQSFVLLSRGGGGKESEDMQALCSNLASYQGSPIMSKGGGGGGGGGVFCQLSATPTPQYHCKSYHQY